MSGLPMSPEQRERLIALLARRAELNGWDALLQPAGLDEVGRRVNLNDPPAVASRAVIQHLQDRVGILMTTGEFALVRLLRVLRKDVAGFADDAAFVDELLRLAAGTGAPRKPPPRRKVSATPAPVLAGAFEGDGGPRLEIFLSHRRKDWPETHRLRDALAARMAADIFVDVDGVDDTDFERSILAHVRACDVMVLMLTEATFAPDRTHRSGDWVRREVALALDLGKPVVLAGVDGRHPPSPADLPEDLQAVPRLQTIEFYPAYWDAAVDRLVRFIETVLEERAAAAGEPPRAAPVTPPPPADGTPTGSPGGPTTDKLVRDAMAARKANDWDLAVFLFETAEARGDAPKQAKVPALLADSRHRRELARRRREAQLAYEYVALLAEDDDVPPAVLSESWDEFRADFPNFQDDPAGVAAKVRVAVSDTPPADLRPIEVPTPSAITPEQRAQLAIMLDPARPPAERAEAGDRLAALPGGDPRPGVGLRADGLPDVTAEGYWCEVPAGLFTMGSDKYDDEKPIRQVHLPTFHVARYPVTYAQYKAFLDARDGYSNAEWWTKPVKLAKRDRNPGKQAWPIANRPAENVSWYDAMAYCRWLSARLGYEVRLPTEEEWEKAAWGTDGREYPWGGSYEVGYANINETRSGWKVGPHYLQRTTTVGVYPQGASPYGALDMGGNVWEWTLTEYENRQSGDFTNDRRRVLRGGSWLNFHDLARAACRFHGEPGLRLRLNGFRLVALAPIRL